MGNKFKKSKVDGCWICQDCGVAVTPTPKEISEHISDCKPHVLRRT